MENFYFGRKDNSVICGMYLTKNNHFVCFGMDENKRKLEFDLKNSTATAFWKQMNEKFLDKDYINIKGIGINCIFFKYNKDNELSLNVYANRIDQEENRYCHTAFYKVLDNAQEHKKYTFVTQKTGSEPSLKKFARLYDDIENILSGSRLNWQTLTVGEQQFVDEIKNYAEQVASESLER